MNLYYWESGIPYKHTKFSVTHNKNEIWGNLYKNIAGLIKNGFLISIIGPRGSGKTQLSACLIHHCSHRTKKPCFYTKVRTMFETKMPLMQYTEPHLLVIDNFEEFKDEWDMGMIDHIIDLRYDREKATLILSNETTANFRARLDPSIIDRMGEQGGLLELDLPSFRQLS